MRHIFLFILLSATYSIAIAQNNRTIDYSKEWKEVKKLQSELLPQATLSKVNEIYSYALIHEDYEHVIKAIIQKVEIQVGLEKSPIGLICDSLLRDAKRLPQPAKSIVYSIIGDVLTSYYIENRWKIMRRTRTEAGDDIETWDIARLFEETVKYYRLSVDDEKSLQQTPYEKFQFIAEDDDTVRQQLIVTLYDYLSLKAINAFNENITYSKPQEVFLLNKPEYFADVNTFVNCELVTDDTLSIEYLTVDLYQKLLNCHLQSDKSAKTLVGIDLERLKYVYNKGRYKDKDVRYESALRNLMNEYVGRDEWGYVAYSLAVFYYEHYREKEHANSAFKSKINETHDLCVEIVSKATDKQIAKYAQDLQRAITNPSLNLVVAPSQCPDTPILALVNYKNTDTLYFWFFKVDENYVEKSRFNIKSEHFVKTKPFATQKTDLPLQNDYREHATEIMINELPQGLYAIFATNTPTFYDKDNKLQVISNNILQVSSLTVAFRTGNEKLFAKKNENGNTVTQLYVADSRSGKPVENVQIEYTRRDSKVERYVSDNEGTVYIPHDVSPKKITATKQDSRFIMFQINTFFHPVLKPEQQVMFFTDRSIYRPGQTVYYKAVCLINDKQGDDMYKLLTETPVNIEFRDVNDKTVAKQERVTNEYGTVQGSFTIPQNLLNGAMSLYTQYGWQSIQVAEYKRPAFEVRFNPVNGTYQLNDSIKISGMAKGLASYNIDNAKIRYRVVRNLQYRLLRWWYPPVLEPSREIASGILTTDDSGNFIIAFKAEAEDVKYDDLIYTYDVTADVTDANGETHIANLSVKTAQNPLLIESSLPENVISDKPLTFSLNTTNLNGDFVPADVSITITALKAPNRILRERLWEKPDTIAISRSEFEQHFPFDPYGDDDNPEKYIDEKQIIAYQIKTVDVKSTIQTDSNKLNLKALSNAASGWYRVDIKAKCDDIEAGEAKYIYLINKTYPASLKSMNDWVVAVNDSAEPGENVELMVAGGEQQSYIHYDIILKNRIIEHKNIVADNIPKKIVIPVKEEYRGGFSLQFVMVQNNRTYTNTKHISVPYSNKQLDIQFITFRDKLLPGEHEKWTLSVKNKNSEKEMAEMAATLYDASLDAFAQNTWSNLYSFLYAQSFTNAYWQSPYPTTVVTRVYKRALPAGFIIESEFMLKLAEPKMYNFEERMFIRGLGGSVKGVSRSANKKADFALNEVVVEEESDYIAYGISPQPVSSDFNITPRRNFNETAFFYPQLRTDEQGEILIEFTVPESLTRWRMLGFAHTGDLKVGSITNELITQKKLMITANAPRFFRENDMIDFTAKINNISNSSLAGQAVLQLYDAYTMQPVDTKIIQTSQTQDFNVKTSGSTVMKWTLEIPAGIQAITYKVVAQADNHSDGEEKTVPVMPNSIMITETMPFGVRAGQQKEFVFNRLKNNHSKVLRNHRLTLEFTSNPAWYAIQSIPYLMEYPYECAEQTFARFYANSLASTVVNSSPRIKQIFDAWRSLPENKDALLSNLEKNQELKQVLLEETPWVMQAQDETERKKRTALLFDLNKMNDEQQKALDKLVKTQLNDGGFPWFQGLPASRFITQHIVAGLEHLKKLNALDESFVKRADNMINKAMKYLDSQVNEDYDKLRKITDIDLEKQHIGYEHLHYLYVCSFSKHKPDSRAFKYYYSQAGKYWTQFNIYAQAMTSLVMNRFGDREMAMKIIRSLNERSHKSDELGMYWNNNTAGYFWYQAPIETQAMMIEAINEVAGDKQAVEEMKIWLLRNKQTNDWKTTKATTEACYALLITGENLLDENRILDINIAGKPLAEAAKEEIRPEPGTGYVKTAWNGSDIATGMATLQVNNPNRNGVAWGGMYWQYFESLDKITGSETNLKLNKQLFLKKITVKGEELLPLNDNNLLKVGDLVVVRMELRADRDYEYVHLKDMRAASFEPVQTISGHRYQDGLWYYENIKDASNNFFITYLRKGTYVFEYELRVTHAGEFANGITTFQCMYAPEFNAHTGGDVKVKIGGL